MLDTRLIFVEGIMGSGKSTLSTFLAQYLQRRGHPVRYVPESFRDHPTYVTPTLPHCYKPWLDASTEVIAAQSLRNWQALVTSAQASGAIQVYDGQLFHGDLTGLMIANAPPAELVAYVDGLLATIAPLRPSFIYLYQDDVGHALARTASLRGGAWLHRQVTWKVDSPYCVARDYFGVAGWFQLYLDFRQLTDLLYERLPGPKLAIENGDQDWGRQLKQVLAFLELSGT